MIKEPEDEAFEELEKAQQRNALFVDKGCAERGCMGYDDRDGDKPVKMRVFDDDDIQEYKKPWRGLTDEDVYPLANEYLHYQLESYEMSGIYNLARAIEAKLKGLNS
jgi:hypothetical protein